MGIGCIKSIIEALKIASEVEVPGVALEHEVIMALEAPPKLGHSNEEECLPETIQSKSMSQT